MSGTTDHATTVSRILTPGRNCWRIEDADRVAFLVDGEAYFHAFRAALAHARHSILILCWDIDTRVQTHRARRPTRWPTELGDLLRTVLRRRRRLHAYVLAWDYHPVYAMEREWLSLFKLQWGAARRLHVHLDGNHPFWASHHQKVVVVDDAVAFVGGLDPTKSRWDTPEHRPRDPRRVDANGDPYPPFHDVHLMMSGPAARALGDLARERWFRATGERLEPSRPAAHDPWPGHVRPDLQRVRVGLARTEPAHAGRPPVREIEQLYLDAIAAARRCVYIETQYFTSATITAALTARLQECGGPDVVIVLHPFSSGWLEQYTMDVLRGNLLEALRQADRYSRLGIYYPDVEAPMDGCLTVHSKVLIVDDALIRIGSANCSNRSMGIDTECDAAIESADDPRIGEVISGFRNRLLAEHLGVSADIVTARIAERGSAIAAIESLRGTGRTLKVYEPAHPPESDLLLSDPTLIDPEKPIHPEVIAERLVPHDHRVRAGKRVIAGAALLLALIALAAAWRWTPLREWLEVQSLAEHAARFQNTGLAPFVVVAGFVIGGLAVVPVTLLIVATVIAFGPWFGLLYAFVGMTLSALVTYGIGRAVGRDFISRVAGSRVDRLSQRLAKQGLLTIVTLRIVPIAPFTVVNLVAGASHISFRHFTIGTIIGEIPGLTAMSVFADQISTALLHPGPKTFILLGVVGAAIIAGTWALRGWLDRKTSEE